MDADANGESRERAAGSHVLAAFSGPPVPTAGRSDVARHGTTEQKWRLAGEDELDDDVVELLVHSGDADAAASLAGNTAVPTRALEQLAELHPEQRYWIGLNPEAPVHLKDAVPIGDHSSYARCCATASSAAPRRPSAGRSTSATTPARTPVGPCSEMSGRRSTPRPESRGKLSARP